ncbi:MAG: hypothetical protein KJ592_04700 [Nanoarchaeota archaeon]|nr:hypothetical protein [Nanoarchaeota archaeon]
MSKKYELLAPVGDFRNLRVAIDAGVDARKSKIFEVVGGRSLALVGGRLELGQQGCRFNLTCATRRLI